MNKSVKIHNNEDLSKLEVGKEFKINGARGYSEAYPGAKDEIYFNSFHINNMNGVPLYISKDYIITSNQSILLRIDFIYKLFK